MAKLLEGGIEEFRDFFSDEENPVVMRRFVQDLTPIRFKNNSVVKFDLNKKTDPLKEILINSEEGDAKRTALFILPRDT